MDIWIYLGISRDIQVFKLFGYFIVDRFILDSKKGKKRILIEFWSGISFYSYSIAPVGF